MRLLCCYLILLFPGALQAQEEKKDNDRIEIVDAEVLLVEDYDTLKLRRLVGNVHLRQDSVNMTCDSAIFYPNQNNVLAFGNIHIDQGDSIDAFGDSLRYFGNERTAWLKGNVRLTDQQMTLQTDDLYYYLSDKVASYYGGGRLTNDSTTLTSEKGHYYTQLERAYFNDSVVLIHPSYSLEADTLEYDIISDIAYFHGPTNILNQENTVYCEGGYYNSPAKVAVFTRNAVLSNPPQTIEADSIYYQRSLGYGEAFGSVLFRDTAENILQFSEYALYNELERSILSVDRNLLVLIVEQDSLFITGDTIRSNEDSLSGNRIMMAYPEVLIYKSNLQAQCDSLFYTEEDSTLRMYENPVMWTDSTQFTADTIIMEMKNSELDKINMYYNAFIANEADSGLYNQIKGKYIFGYFREEELRQMEVTGNGESIYYAQDELGAYIGVNKAICSNMLIYVKERQVDKINFLNKPEATFYPIQQVNFAEYVLEGFDWLEELKPTSKNDLLKEEKAQLRGSTTNPSVSRSDQKAE